MVAKMNSDSLDPKIATQLFKHLSDDSLVLVGGQSVMVWAHFYGLVDKSKSYTKDIDFFGNSADIEAANLRLSSIDHETRFAELDDPSPNSGLILLSLPGHQQKIRVDYLWSVYGLAGSDIQERAVPLTIQGTDVVIRVLHPLMCLESKTVNLGAFPLKRDKDGVAQAKTSIEIAKAYIQQLLNENRERDALNAAERVFRIAQLDAASFSWHVFGLNVIESIPEQGLPPTFYEVRLPQMEIRLNEVRRAFKRRLPELSSPASTARMRF